MKQLIIFQDHHHPNTLPTGRLVRSILLLGALALFGFFANQGSKADEIDVWIGTSGASGIYYVALDTEKGKLSKPRLAHPVDGAGFLAMAPDGKSLYSTAKEQGEGGVTAFSIEKIWTGDLQIRQAKARVQELSTIYGADHSRTLEARKRLNGLTIAQRSNKKTRMSMLKKLGFLSSGDGGAACVGVDKTGKFLMSAQYGGGSTTTYSIKPDGSLDETVQVVEHGKGSGVNRGRQATSHPHWVGTSPDNRFVMVPDLGMDRVVVYELDADTGELKLHSKVPVPPGSGPRHMKFHTSGKFVYVLNELTLTINVFEYDPQAAEFKPIQLIESLPEALKDKNPNSAAEIRVHPSGKFVYSSNRGHDSISVFSVDQETGRLTFVEREPIRGSWPRNFNLDPTGKWLIAAGARSNTLALFEVNSETGRLQFSQNVVNVPSPICVLFDVEAGSGTQPAND